MTTIEGGFGAFLPNNITTDTSVPFEDDADLSRLLTGPNREKIVRITQLYIFFLCSVKIRPGLYHEGTDTLSDSEDARSPKHQRHHRIETRRRRGAEAT